LAWWVWAWHTRQAAAWDDGALYAIARRARLQDVMESDGEINGSMAREIREMDDRLGLTPKAMAALRWKIVEEAVDRPARQGGRRGLSAVPDASAV
jgi:hypothetical protein